MMDNKIERIEFMEKSIGSIFKPEFWSTDIKNTIEAFKTVVRDDLVFEISDILDEDYKYTHEAILTNVTTHGLFQFTLNMPDVTTLATYESDLLVSYKSYLDNRIISSFENLKTHEAIVVTIDLFTLVYCYVTVSKVRYVIKEIMIDALKDIVSCYEHYNGSDSLSILLLELKEGLSKTERHIYGE